MNKKVNKSNKISVSYRLEKSVTNMINTLSKEENRNITNLIETIIKKYYKETRKFNKLIFENLTNKKLLELVTIEYNKMADCLEYPLADQKDFQILSEELNIEFENKAMHIDNGQYALKSGIESKHWIKNIKTNDQYLVKNIKYKGEKNNLIKIDYIT